MYFVVDDQTPVVLREESQVLERLFSGAAVGQHLVGGQGDRADVLVQAGVFADLIGADRGFVQQFVSPLVGGNVVGGDDQGLVGNAGHHAQADDGFAGATGQDNDAAAAPDSTCLMKGIALHRSGNRVTETHCPRY